MSRSLRLVLVAPYPVLPASAGGKIRIVQLARALCKLGVQVTIVAPYHVTQRRALAGRESFNLYQVPYGPFLLASLFADRPFPYGMLVSYHPGYRVLLPVPLDSFDVCEIEHPAFVDLVRDVPQSIPVVYGSQNVEFDYVSAECRSGTVRDIAGRRVRRLEAQLVSRAAHTFACTAADRRRFGDLYGVSEERVSVIPNGVDLDAVDAARAHRPPAAVTRPARFPRRAIFAGSDVIHNRTAVQAIVTHIAPALEREVEFVIVGPCARRVRRELSPNVYFDPDGDVPRYAGPDALGLNPVVAGSGSSLKLLQYLACDLPVVSTPFGMRGFEDLAPWVVTAELDAFPDVLRKQVPAPRGVREHLIRYEWSAVAAKALGVYEGLAREGRARRIADRER